MIPIEIHNAGGPHGPTTIYPQPPSPILEGHRNLIQDADIDPQLLLRTPGATTPSESDQGPQGGPLQGLGPEMVRRLLESTGMPSGSGPPSRAPSIVSIGSSHSSRLTGISGNSEHSGTGRPRVGLRSQGQGRSSGAASPRSTSLHPSFAATSAPSSSKARKRGMEDVLIEAQRWHWSFAVINY